jgi:hypothetical protein
LLKALSQWLNPEQMHFLWRPQLLALAAECARPQGGNNDRRENVTRLRPQRKA